MSITQPNDQAHHRRHLNIKDSININDDSRDFSLPNSPELLKQSHKAKVTEYRKKYDIDVSHDQNVYKNAFWTQSKALLGKNFALQSKQKGTNLCQVRYFQI